ncbi:ligase-associated DNA damage response endonuclease PdeM [Algoriphagus sp. A40]|uniref:ligase-associated DNA damage response endonuclease PdeM n=1 Tax=Algoriphagus sp. A40 TaxID=1945863 RepID=UPI000984E475|nr:ligase-associated DNA damage response endonuclease PdeM [Algoriphagus sp. A40]
MPEIENLIKPRNDVSSEFEGVLLSLLKEKAVWIKSLNTLLIADLHFGKAAHFRKSGIPIPEPVHDFDLLRLQRLHEEFRPVHTYFLGDLFHSDWNDQWEILNQFLGQFIGTEFHLVKGNHDVLSFSAYQQSVLRIHEKPLTIGRFVLSHEPMESVPDGMLNICGHIHPGVRLVGKAKQSLRLPCFFQSKSQLLLPAFGNFTGLALVRPKDQDKVWAITEEKIIPVLSGTSIG